VLNKSNVLAVGVLLIALGLYLQTTYIIEGHQIGEYLKKMDAAQFTLLVTTLFWAGLIVVIVSIVIKPKKRMIAVPETVEAPRRPVEAAYSVEEAIEAEGEEARQVYEESPPTPEEATETSETFEEEVKKPGEVIGFCPRCGAPVTEGMRYCRKCGLKLK